MASNYPGSLDSFDTIASDKKTSDTVGGRTHRDMHNDVADAVEAVQAELGTDPAGAYATVKARFEAIEGSTLPQIDAKGDLVVGTADNTYDNLPVGANNTVLVADSAQTKGVKWGTTVGVWTVAGLHVGYTTKTSAYTATTSDDVINVSSGSFTLDLPAASTCTGKTLKVTNTGTGVVTLDGNASEPVAGVATFPLGSGSYVEITSTGSAWILTGGAPDTGWRNVSAGLLNGWVVSGSDSDPRACIRRIGKQVFIHFALDGSSATNNKFYTLPTGFGSSPLVEIDFSYFNGIAGTFVKGVVYSDELYLTGRDAASRADLNYSTTAAWPTSLPGTAV